jgi:NADPH2:quinone reductase
MKALVYKKANTLDQFALELADVDEPPVRDTDVLVEIKAIGVNPGEAFIRGTRSAPPGGRVILGWEFAGVVIGSGMQAKGKAGTKGSVGAKRTKRSRQMTE